MIQIPSYLTPYESDRILLDTAGLWVAVELPTNAPAAMLLTPSWGNASPDYIRFAYGETEPDNDKCAVITSGGSMLFLNSNQIKNLWIKTPDAAIEVGIQFYQS